ncbi:hypothetical protein L3Q65_18370 [Amycolatopsis sp. FU40]|uniref:hypothetical protein n=1 Tax=Amycolatopsis sp. FU40 TaxID=2914159 RepID=UPI001F3F4ED1|nr:hypothetical protein [Amycolatopsis sp. FU40]UKD58603.1 hypothetical protein L3Q65_18370 [Amycolatopsis sp. FU40]
MNNIRHDIVDDQATRSPCVDQPGGSVGEEGFERLRRAMLDNGASTRETAEALGRRRGLGPLSAWRHALGLTRDEVATRYNAAVVSNRRLSDTATALDPRPMTAELVVELEAEGNDGRGFITAEEAEAFAKVFQADPTTLQNGDAWVISLNVKTVDAGLPLLPGESVISIYTTADDGTLLQEAVVELLEACGLEAELWDRVHRGSWFRRFRARSQARAAADKLADLASKLERAAELKYIDTPRSESDVREANAVAQLLQHTGADEEIVICLSSVLFVKTRGTIVVKVLNENEIRVLKQYPRLLKSPGEILDGLARHQSPAPTASEPGALTPTLPSGRADRPTS